MLNIQERYTYISLHDALKSRIKAFIFLPLLCLHKKINASEFDTEDEMNIIKEYLKEWKDRKLIELACTQLNQAWEQLIENHREFQALCEDNKDLQEADTWLLESQALVEELICRSVDYGEVKFCSGEMVSKPPNVQMEGTKNSSITSFGRPSKKSSGKTTSSVSQEHARAVAREGDIAKPKVKHLKKKAELEPKIAAQKAQPEAEPAIQEAEHEAGRREIEALLLKEDLDEFNQSEHMKDFEDNPVGGDKIKMEAMLQVK